MAIYHFGVIKALHDQDLLPRILCGSSSGAFTAAMICTRRLEDIGDVFNVEGYNIDFLRPIDNLYKNFFKEKAYFDKDHMETFFLEKFQDLTFEEVYRQFGWILNINVSIEN